MSDRDFFAAADLFCGAGGLSLGIAGAGFNIIEAIDNNKKALETYQNNIGDHTRYFDLYEDIPSIQVDLITGGPPCQGFSSAGKRDPSDNRNTLVRRFAQTIAENLPKAFIFENVEGFITADEGLRLFDLLDPLIEVGYKIHLQKINAGNFGVPQHRKRVIAIGGLGWEPSFPPFTHAAYGAPGARSITATLPRTPSIAEALSGLPAPTSVIPGNPSGHVAKTLRGIELERALVLQQGQTMRDLPPSLQHESFTRRAFRRVMDGTPTEKRGGAPAGIKRLKANEPSKAVTSGMASEFLHPTEHRPLTIRECARLQTFPDEFIFFGNAREQMSQIANAIPPRLALQIAESVMADLRQAIPSSTPGELLTFIPTTASAMSPALKKVVALVRDRYATYASQEIFVL